MGEESRGDFCSWPLSRLFRKRGICGALMENLFAQVLTR